MLTLYIEATPWRDIRNFTLVVVISIATIHDIFAPLSDLIFVYSLIKLFSLSSVDICAHFGYSALVVVLLHECLGVYHMLRVVLTDSALISIHFVSRVHAVVLVLGVVNLRIILWSKLLFRGVLSLVILIILFPLIFLLQLVWIRIMRVLMVQDSLR